MPCPFRSLTSVVREWALNPVGAFAARSGAVRSAPVSITAIVNAPAAVLTSSGTVSSCTAVYAHSSGRLFPSPAVSPGSAREERAANGSTYRIPGRQAIRAANRSADPCGRTSATCKAGTRRTSVPCARWSAEERACSVE